MGDDEELLLDDVWSIFHHGMTDSSWTLDSYTRVATVSSAEEFWGVHSLVCPLLHTNLFFVMREHIFPCWDDAANIDGGCISARVPMHQIGAYWEALCVRLLCEGLCPGKAGAVNGISSSPKQSWCVVKVWLSCEVAVEDMDMPAGFVGTLMFRWNRDSISNDRCK